MSEHTPDESTTEPSLSLLWGTRLSLWGCLSGLVSVGVVWIAARIIKTSPGVADVLLYIALVLGFLTTFCMPGLLLTFNGWSQQPRTLRWRGLILGLLGTGWFFLVIRPLLSLKD